MNSTFTAIAACDAESGIGLNNAIPWKLKEDMQRFKTLTSGHPIIMGRKTFESIGSKPLPNRFNIVVTSRAVEDRIGQDTADVAFVSSIHLAHSIASRKAEGKEVFVIGGEGIYNAFLNHGYIDRILMTYIKKSFGCDTHFPPLGLDWCEISCEVHNNGEFEYSFVEYNKRISK